MSIIFKRALNGSFPPGYWKHATEAAMQVSLCCPECAITLLLPQHKIAANGIVSPPVECPRCGFQSKVQLGDYNANPAAHSALLPAAH